MTLRQSINDMPGKQPDQGWHITKTISITHLITTLAMVVTVVAFGLRIESHVAMNTADIQDNEQDIRRVERVQLGQYAEIIRRLERISDKLDSKADK